MKKVFKKVRIATLALFLSLVFALQLALPANAAVIGSGYDAYCTYNGRGVTWTGREAKDCPGILNVYYKGSFQWSMNTGYITTMTTRQQLACNLKLTKGIITAFIPGKNWVSVGKAVLGMGKAGMALKGCHWKN